MINNMGELMKQAQKIQEQMQKAQEDLARAETEGASGGGLVKITMTGRHDVRKVIIDPALMSEDKEVLEDLIAAAVNDAVRKIEETSKQRMAGFTAGLGMPPGFKMPF